MLHVKSSADSASGEQKRMKAGLSPLGTGKALARDKAYRWDCLTKITLAALPLWRKTNQTQETNQSTSRTHPLSSASQTIKVSWKSNFKRNSGDSFYFSPFINFPGTAGNLKYMNFRAKCLLSAHCITSWCLQFSITVTLKKKKSHNVGAKLLLP